MGARHLPPAERFFAMVNKTETCWLWTGATLTGYGRFKVGGGDLMTLAHRYAYTLMVGPIPEGLTIDHLCRVTNCVNPDHLEPVTMAENTARKPRVIRCPQGHEYDEANTYYRRPRSDGLPPNKRCRACNRQAVAARRLAAKSIGRLVSS